MADKYTQVFVTVPSRREADRLAKVILEARLVACVQIAGPITSRYWWRGRLETANEWLCLLKTEGRLFRRLDKAIRALHTYETPEIVAVAITAGSQAYLKWIAAAVK